MTRLHDKLPDFLQKFRSQKRNIVNNRLVVGIVRKIAMSLANRLVLVRKFVKAVAPQTLPKTRIFHMSMPGLPTLLSTPGQMCAQREEFGSSLFVLVLKTPQKRRNVVARLGVELDVRAVVQAEIVPARPLSWS